MIGYVFITITLSLVCAVFSPVDPYEPMAESSWRRRQEEQARPEPDENVPPEGMNPEDWKKLVIESREAGACLEARQHEELDENSPPPGIALDSWKRIVASVREERALEADVLRRAEEKKDDE